MTQCERILRHLEDYGSITSAEAITEYSIYRLASRISDLKSRVSLSRKRRSAEKSLRGADKLR